LTDLVRYTITLMLEYTLIFFWAFCPPNRRPRKEDIMQILIICASIVLATMSLAFAEEDASVEEDVFAEDRPARDDTIRELPIYAATDAAVRSGLPGMPTQVVEAARSLLGSRYTVRGWPPRAFVSNGDVVIKITRRTGLFTFTVDMFFDDACALYNEYDPCTRLIWKSVRPRKTGMVYAPQLVARRVHQLMGANATLSRKAIHEYYASQE